MCLTQGSISPIDHADDCGPLGILKLCNIFEIYRGIVARMYAGGFLSFDPARPIYSGLRCCTASAMQTHSVLSKKRGGFSGLNFDNALCSPTFLMASITRI